MLFYILNREFIYKKEKDHENNHLLKHFHELQTYIHWLQSPSPWRIVLL